MAKLHATVATRGQSNVSEAQSPYVELAAWIGGIALFIYLVIRLRRVLGRAGKFIGRWALILFVATLAFALVTLVLDAFTTIPTRVAGHALGWNFYGTILETLVCMFLLSKLDPFIDELRELFGGKRSLTERVRVRGRALISFERIKELAANFRGPFWGFVSLPAESAVQHFAVIGSTGSGKTMLLRLLMQSILPGIKEGSDSRALIYDAKADIIPILDGMRVTAPVLILNPFDERSASWKMGEDVTAPATAQQIATILVAPAPNEAQPFFTDASRALLTGVMVSFLKRCPGDWVLSDVLHATRSSSVLREVLLATEETRYLVGQYLDEERTAQNILSSLATKLQPFEFIAAAWDRAESSVSLREWLKSDAILVLGNDEAMRSALDAINRVIFRRITELVLAESESTTRRTWFFLDEIRQAGILDGLNNLLTVGRSKGACVAIGTQDIEGLREVYGDNKANELLGLCGHKAVLRLDSASTAKWASELFGAVEDLETRTSQSSSESGDFGQRATTSGTQVSEQHIVRDVVLPSELLSLPFPSRTNGMIGYFLSPEFGGSGYRAHISGDWVAQALSPLGSAPAARPRPESHQFLSPWSESRRSQLCSGQQAEQSAQQKGNLDKVLDDVLAESKGPTSRTSR